MISNSILKSSQRRRTFVKFSSNCTFTSSVLYSWGVGTDGQLGHQKFVTQGSLFKSYIQIEPRKLVKSSIFAKVACAHDYTIGLSTDGDIYGWGKDYIGNKQSNEPELIPFPGKIIEISAGSNHSAAIDDQGVLFTWGAGGSWLSGGGQLGHGVEKSEYAPREVAFFKEYQAKVAQVACGTQHTLILTTDGEVLACGIGENGRLGIGSSENINLPVSLTTLVDDTVISVAAGDKHSACITTDGRLFTWGKNDAGQLGHSDTNMDVLYSMEEFPRHLEGLPPIKQVSLSTGRTAAVTQDGLLYMWGSEFDHVPRLIPQNLFDGMKVSKAVLCGGAGGMATLVITEDGGLWSFGDYGSHLLGLKKMTGFSKSKENNPRRIDLGTNASTNSQLNLGIKLGSVIDIFGGFGRHAFLKVEVISE